MHQTKDGTLMIDKDQFATYPRACNEALATQAEGEVAGAYASHSPALKWDNGPVCGIAPGGMEIICSGSENDGGGTGNIECFIYKYNDEGEGPFLRPNSYPGQSCYD